MKMQWTSVIMVAGLLLFGATAVTGQEATPDSDQEQLIQAFYSAFEAKDADAVAAMLTEDVTLVMPFTFSGATEPDTRFVGHEQVMRYFGSVFTNFAQIRFVDAEINVSRDGETVFAEATGDFIAAQGDLPYRNVYIIKFQLRNGQIATISEYANPVIYAMTFGAELGTANQ